MKPNFQILRGTACVLLLLASFLTLRLAPPACAQTNYPLPGRTIVKLVPDYLRPQVYALNQANGSVPGTVLALNATNGTLLSELTVNTNPTDMVITPDGGTLYVINTGSRTISKIDLNSFAVVAEKAIATPNAYSPSAPLYLTAGNSNLVYFTDGAWAPDIYAFDYNNGTNLYEYSGSAYLDYNNVATPNGAGGLLATKDGRTLYTWLQYGWGAGYAYSVITRLTNGTTTLTPLEYGPLQGRDPLNTPILLDAAGQYVFNKVQMVSATNVSVLLRQFSDNIYAITADGSAAFGPTEVFDTKLGTNLLSLPFSATVQAVSGNQQELFRFNAATTNLVVYSLTGLLAPNITQQPANQVVYSGNNAVVSVGVTGLSPLAFLWSFNGTNFALTTNSQVIITNFQAANAGSYSVTITNAFGFAASSNAVLTATNAAPFLVAQPAGLTAVASSNATFAISVSGVLPMGFQWQFNGTNLSGATNATLTLANLQLSNQGNYAVVITNAYGMATSSNAYLTVVDLAKALNTTNLVWSTGPALPWFVQDNPNAYDAWGLGNPDTHDGFASMESGNTTAGQQSILQTAITGPATLTFWWQTVSLSTADYLACSLNGVQQASINNVNSWAQQKVYLGAGTNLLQWDYVTVADPAGKGAAWLDQVNVAPGGTPPIITLSPSAQVVSVNSNAVMTVAATGTPPFTYQWQFNGTNLAAATNATLTLSNLPVAATGYYAAIVGNGFGSTNSASAYLNVVNPVAALNATNLAWTAGGNAPWFVETAVTYDGFAAMQSGNITAGQQSTLQTTVTGPGTLTFWWNVSSEAVNDYLYVSVNGTEQARISGIITGGFYGWQQPTIYLGAGTQTVQWTYLKTDSGVSGSGRDSGWLDQVSFTPGGTPPFFSVLPTNQVVLLGSNATLSATALGTPPLACQWQLNLTNLAAATNQSFAVTNAQFANEGYYTLVVSNAFGLTNTAGANLNVVDFTESLNATNLTWSSAGNLPWFSETATTHDGIAALRSGAITGSQQSTVQTTVTGPGTLGYWWQISSETNNDYLNFSLDGAEQSRISGTVNWQPKTWYLTPGTHTLAWSYNKNATVNSGSDAGWLDQVSYQPGTTAAAIATNPVSQVAAIGSNATFSVSAIGTPPLAYQWLFWGSALANATNGTLTITGAQVGNAGAYQVVVTNGYGNATSSTASLILQNVAAWGAGTSNPAISPNYGQSIVPANLVGATALAAGGFHSLALLPSGGVTAWGCNSYGETNIPFTLTNATALAAGLYLSVALRSNGTVTAWGQSSYGQTTVPAAATNVAAIAAGWYHTLALRSNGTVLAWGAGTSQSSSPVLGQCLVPTNLPGVTAIAAGGYHSLALLTNTTVVAWGWNAFGQTNVPPGLTNVIAIAAGGSNSLALKNDGTVVAWGANGYGQTNLPAGLTNVIAIAAGAAHGLALKSDGSLAAWGLNANGQTNVPAGLTNFTAIAAGGYHSLALINVGPVTFLVPPARQTVYLGSNATFTALVQGAAPVSYQWLLNGTNAGNATNASLTITNAQFASAGIYQLAAGNAFGTVLSAPASLTVNNTAPYFTLQPSAQAVLQFSNVTLAANAGGLPPLAYQWQLNGVPVAGATNAAITISNAQPVNGGQYSLTASNAYGLTVSSNAYLNVIDVPEALGPTNLIWQNLSSPGWFAESTNTHDGFAAAATGPLPYGGQTFLQTYVTGPGTVSFWWSAQLSVTMSFLIDGVSQTIQGGSAGFGWQSFTFYLPAKVHALTWKASNQLYAYPAVYTNAGFVDQVVFTPGITPATITAQPASQTNAAGASVTLSAGVSGTPPLSCQWYFNGSPVAGATSASLTLNNLQAGNAGTYLLLAVNDSGPVTSSNAVLTVTSAAPVITGQPTGGPVLTGGSFSFGSGATGSSPLYYQWLFNGLPVAGATNASLALSGIQYSNAGNYSLLASNTAGTAASSNALLFVYSPPDLAAALDDPALAWSTTNVPWFPQTNTTHDGVSAAQSGTINASQQSTLQAVVTGPAMVIYWWSVNCDSFWDSLAFSDNGTILSSITGTVSWQLVTNYIGSGSRTLQWNLYPVYGAFAGGTGWVDQVQIIPIAGMAAALITGPADTSANAGGNVSWTAGATGTPTLLYQWLFNGTNLPGATNATLTLNNVQAANAGRYAVTVTNDFGFSASSNATLSINPAIPVITFQPQSQTNVVNGSAAFTVAASGSSPFSYQWYFNSSPLAGATSNRLVLPAPQLADAGNYSVVVSNQYGQATSTVAGLTVVLSKVTEFWPYGYSGYTAPAGLGDAYAVAVGVSHTMVLRTDGTVLAWGGNLYGQTNVPAGLSNVVAIAAGNNHCLVLKANGTLMAWGDNGYGQGSVPAGLSNVVAIAAGPVYNLALKADGTVTAWGGDYFGQTDLPAGLTNVQAVFAGINNGFARRADGSLVQWGNRSVWLHNGTNAQLQADAGAGNVVAVAAGIFSGWTLQPDGTALAYGWYDGVSPFTNNYPSMSSWSTTVSGRHSYSSIVSLAAGGGSTPLDDYALLLGANGQITQVGTQGGQFSLSTLVPSILNQPTNATAVAARQQHAAALAGDGSPHILWPPVSQTVFSGATVMFVVGAGGGSPLSYQWQCDGTNIGSATGSLLVLTNVPLSAAGSYVCLVTNSVGSAASTPATLAVLRSTPGFAAAAALSGSGFSWQLNQLSGHGNLVILVSSNLVDWQPLYTNPPVTGTFQFVDPAATNRPCLFYRAVEQ